MLLFVMIDALRHDYINGVDSPYLYSLAHEGLSGSVMPSFGFEPDAAYLAGLRPDEADGGAMFWFDPDGSPFAFARFLPASLDNLPERPARFVRKGIRLIAQLTARDVRLRHWASPAWIPLTQLPRFAFASTRLIDEPGFLPAPTIFDHLRAADRLWYFHGMPTYRVAATTVCSRFLNELTGRESYAFLHIGDLDGVGHHYGPWSDERRAALRHLDDILSQIVAYAQSKTQHVDLLILGDHGMAEVEQTLDVTPVIKRLDERGLKFDYFIDATFFRCWSHDASVLTAIRDEVSQLRGLVEIGQIEVQRYGLQYSHHRFWDLCWQAEVGLVFTPNFHNGHQRLLGMHGYLPECQDNWSAFVLSSSRLPADQHGQFLEAVDMRRFFATQLTLLDLPHTSLHNGSLI
jgi:hypothetical protein